MWPFGGIAEAPLFKAALVLACAVLGCTNTASGGRWRQADYHLSYGLPLLDRNALRDPAAHLEDVSIRFWILADNQRRELLGNNTSSVRTGFIDETVSENSIRPPQLDLFGQDLLREALDRTDGFVLHLGDACDISNSGEFGRFAWDMRRARDGWLMAPGNHDGYFLGSSSRVGEGWIRQWNDTAETVEQDGVAIASRAMQKNDFIAYYLAALVLQNAPWSAPLARRLGPECAAIRERWSGVEQPSFVTYWQYLERLKAAVSSEVADGREYRIDLSDHPRRPGRAMLRRIAWTVERAAPWKSYLVQEIDVSAGAEAISVLVLDTAQYASRPSGENSLLIAPLALLGAAHFQVASTHGNVLSTQRTSLDWMIEAMRSEERRWISAIHHTYRELGRSSSRRFDVIRDAGRVPLVLSAHSHNGRYIWHHDSQREGAWLELNVGSILDAPVEFRDFQVQRLGGRLAVRSRRFTMEDELRSAGLLVTEKTGARPAPGDADYYMTYRTGWSLSPEATERAIHRTLLMAYLRMFRLFPTDERGTSKVSWPGSAGCHECVLTAIESRASRTRGHELVGFLRELREYDRTRHVPENHRRALRAYRLSQAIWAGQAEWSVRNERPPDVDPDISFVLLPKETGAQRRERTGRPPE